MLERLSTNDVTKLVRRLKRTKCPSCGKYADKRGAYKVGKAVYRIYVHISRQCIVKER